MVTKGMLRDRARGMRKQASRAEDAVWDLVRSRKLGAKFRRQHPVEGYIADFACVEAKLIVEVDGLSHEVADQRVYDAERTRVLAAAGWRVLRVRDRDVLGEPRAVERIIRAALNPLPREGERAG
ncbi:MAG: endonuclease domain-containing protein [Hyphomonadaceae bacterium]